MQIIGVSGSGKTTFARRLAKKTGIPLIHGDDILWETKFSKIREEKERNKIFKRVLAPKDWIFEGAGSSWTQPVVEKVELVVWLRKPRRVVYPRTIKRFFKRAITKSHDETMRSRWALLKYIWNFYGGEKEKKYEEIVSNAKKAIVIRNSKEKKEFERKFCKNKSI